ncbi:hypothetical protein E2C01_093186 [Portunus trituberculatus]|uniref:Uncharacterized protein n=1 Tax=Portunus trituberculatus TaxID=210409 RepID=A0A5B7JSK9_PORTR|nr:hypothetical protein [Portunus trituberculatus]
MVRAGRRRCSSEGRESRVETCERAGSTTAAAAVTAPLPLLAASTTTKQRPLSLALLGCVSPQHGADRKVAESTRSTKYCQAEDGGGEAVARRDRRHSFSGSRLMLALRRRSFVKAAATLGGGGGEGENSPRPSLFSEPPSPALAAPGSETDARQSTSPGACLRDAHASPRRGSQIHNAEGLTDTVPSAPRRRHKFRSASTRPKTWSDDLGALDIRVTLPPSTALHAKDADTLGRPLSWGEEGDTDVIPDPVWPPNEWRSPNSSRSGVFSFFHSLHRLHSVPPDSPRDHLGNLDLFPS